MSSSVFSSSPASGPPMSWEDPMSYPAIKGLSVYRNVTFRHFKTFCGSNKRDYIISPHLFYGDIIHPVQFVETTLEDVEDDSKVSCFSVPLFVDYLPK